MPETPQAHSCPKCGAPVEPGLTRCPYCGIAMVTGQPVARAAPVIDYDAAEFGFERPTLLALGLGLAAAIYAIGWWFEDTEYWLDTRAVVTWTVLLPLWLALVVFAWRPRWGQWFLGIGFALAVFAAHVGVMAVIEGRLNDDDFGISGMVAGAAFAGWCVGRILHIAVVRSRARARSV